MRSARGWQAPLAHQRLAPFAALVAAELLKLNDGRASWTDLRRYLVEHPGFIWLLGFPLVPAPNDPLGFNAQASLPTHRHLVRMLRQVPNAALQFLLADSVRLILTELASLGLAPPECVSLDTKHTRSVAWVKENNPKTYVPDRFNKTKPPPGDPDCRLAPPAPSHAGTGNTASSGARTSRRPASCACCRLTASLAPNAKPTVIASS